jgi:hypothetical protein
VQRTILFSELGVSFWGNLSQAMVQRHISFFSILYKFTILFVSTPILSLTINAIQKKPLSIFWVNKNCLSAHGASKNSLAWRTTDETICKKSYKPDG